MFGRHVIRLLSAHYHGESPPGETLRIEAHLQKCAKCRRVHDEIRLGARLASALSVTAAPDVTWKELRRSAPASAQSGRRWIVPAAVPAGILAVAVLVFVFWMRNPGPTEPPIGPSWEVTGLPGTPLLRPGEALQTDSSSEAQVKIANIGQLTVDRNTRIRLLVTHADEHRIAVDRGKVEAMTWAPPRLFIVETPSATAVDLGCRYTLEVDDDGSSLLHVTLGLVALERDGRETIVPAGAFCRTRSGSGPGVPYFEDSSAEFQSLLEQVDSLSEGSERRLRLESLIRESRARDALSLWHLLPRLDPHSRGLIYDRLVRFFPPPPEVTREGIAALDPGMLDAWKHVVSQLWQ
jgi:hypothetical protein